MWACESKFCAPVKWGYSKCGAWCGLVKMWCIFWGCHFHVVQSTLYAACWSDFGTVREGVEISFSYRVAPLIDNVWGVKTFYVFMFWFQNNDIILLLYPRCVSDVLGLSCLWVVKLFILWRFGMWMGCVYPPLCVYTCVDFNLETCSKTHWTFRKIIHFYVSNP